MITYQNCYSITHILDYVSSDMRVFQEDVKNAFGRSFMNPDCTPCILPELMDDDLAMVYTHGFFEWCGLQMEFGCISRPLKNLIQQLIHETGLIYVDDTGDFVHHSHGCQDLDKVRVTLFYLLDKNSMSDKHHYGLPGSLNGWFVDLSRAFIRPNYKGI